MPDDMLEDAIAISKKTLDEHDFEADGVEVRNAASINAIQIARKVKKHMDEKWEPYWHVFLGKSFGCHSVHERNRFVYFTFEPSKISFLIYKAS
jgi:dynein light chain LC8-type